MYNRRNSLRNSQQRYSGLSPAAAAAMVSFNQQNPRQNNAVLAAGAAAEALRRHSLDAQGAQMVANFRRNSMTSQSGRTNSMTRRNSLRTTSTVNRDQYGRAMSLTKTTVRQMGSFELVKEEETAVRRPPGGGYPPPESIYSLDSFAEEPEYCAPSQQQQHQYSHQNQYQQQNHHHQQQQSRQDRANRSRVSFLDDTAEFHYEAYDNSESNALAAAAAAAPQRHLKPVAPISQTPKHRSPMKSALKKNNLEQSPISFSSYDEPEPIYEDEEDFEDDVAGDHKNRPLSAVSEFSTITAKSRFENSDDEDEQVGEDYRSSSNTDPYIPNETSQNTHANQYAAQDDEYSPSENEDEDTVRQPLTVAIPDNENNYAGPLTPSGPSQLPSLAKANVSPVKRDEQGNPIAQESPVSQHPRNTTTLPSGPANDQFDTSDGRSQQSQVKPLAQTQPLRLSQGQQPRQTQSQVHRSGPAQAQTQAPRRVSNRTMNGHAQPVNNGGNNAGSSSTGGTQRRSSLRNTQPNQSYRSQPIPRQDQGYQPQPQQQQQQAQVQRQLTAAKQQQHQRQQQALQQAQQVQQRPRPQQPHQYVTQGGASKQSETGNMTRSNSFRPSRLSLPPNAGQQFNRRPQSPSNRESFVAPPVDEVRQLQPSPSIDGFNRIASTNDILEKARNRARAFGSDQHEQPMTIASIAQMENDDAASVNSESSWKRSTAASKSKFRSSVDMSPVGGRRAPSITSSQFGGGSRMTRISSPNNGRTYSLRGAPPPDLNRNWRSRFEDSDDEDVAHVPSSLPQIPGTTESSSGGGRKAKKPGFFKRLFAKHI